MSNKRQVNMDFTLVGRTRPPELWLREYTNKEILSTVMDKIKFHFGERPYYIYDEDEVTIDKKLYPEFYAAGWFTSINEDNSLSELVVLAHGSSMMNAKFNMIRAVERSDWENLSKTI